MAKTKEGYMKRFTCKDRVHIDGLTDCTDCTGTVVDWYVSVKGQSIKVEFDQPCINPQGIEFEHHWIDLYNPSLTITRLEQLTNEIYI